MLSRGGKLGKSVVTRRRVEAGHQLTPEDLTVKVSDPKGINPNRFPELVGRVLKQPVDGDEPLCEEDLV